jgi:hypothetical protein
MVALWLGLSLSSVSKHNMLLYYGWNCRCFRQSVNTTSGHITTTCCIYWPTKTMTNPTILRSFVVFTDWRKQWQTQPYYDHLLCLLIDENNDNSNHNTTTQSLSRLLLSSSIKLWNNIPNDIRLNPSKCFLKQFFNRNFSKKSYYFNFGSRKEKIIFARTKYF